MPKLSELTGGDEKKKIKLSDVQPKPAVKPKNAMQGFDPSKPVSQNISKRFATDYAGFDSLQHRLLDLPVAIGQGAANIAGMLPVDALKDNADSYNQFVQQREQDYQKRNPDNLATYTGAIVGGALPFLSPQTGIPWLMESAGNLSRFVPAVTKAPGLLNSAAGLASRTGQRVVGGSAQGGLAALLMPDTDGDKLAQVGTGAITGALLPVGVAAGIGGLKAGKYAWENTLGNLLPSQAESRAAQMLRESAVRPESLNVAQPSRVPGVQRTLAEETQDEGIAGLQNVFKNPAVDDVRRDLNNTMRNQYLEGVTGTAKSYADALKFRETNNQGTFDAARAVQFKTPKPVEKSPLILPKGFDRGKVDIEPDEIAPLIEKLNNVKASYKGGKSETVIQGYINRIKAAKGNGLILDNIRRDLDFAMSNKSGDVNIRDLQMVKSAFADFLKQKPEFEKALSGWARDSKPINRMDIGRAMVSPSSKGAAQDRAGYEVLKPQTFKGKLDDIDTVAQRATGFNRAKAADYLTPQDMQRFGNVMDDLERQRFADTKGALFGSPTAQRLQANKQLEATLISRIPVARTAFKWLDDIGQERLKSALADVLNDPAKAREVIAKYPVNDRLVIENAIRSMGWQGVLLGGGTR